MIKNFFAVLAVIFCINSTAFAEDDLFAQELAKILQDFEPEKNSAGLEVRYFSLGANANLNTNSVNLNNCELNLKDNLNLISNHATEFILRYKNFSIDYLQMQKRGGGIFSAENNLTFGGENFTNSVSAKNNLQYIKLNLENEIISLMGTGAFWSYGLTGVYWRGNVETSTKNYFVPVPTVGFGIYMAIMPKITIYSQISGMYFGGRGHLHDFESGLRYSPSKIFSLTAGFRSIGFNFKHNGNGNFRFVGPFIGLRSDF